MSETNSCRERLAPYCVGNGLDVGAGGSAILKTAICVDRAEEDGRRAHVGSDPTHLVGDAADLYWFRDSVLDYVFSSHVLEDFEDTAIVLKEWLRVLKPGGHLVLFLPDQQTYVADCAKNGGLPNQAHKHADFGLDFVKRCLASIGYTKECVVYEEWPFIGNPYSFAIVVKKPVPS